MNFIVTDRESIEAGLLVRTAYVVISIRDPDKKKAAVRKTSGLRDTTSFNSTMQNQRRA